MPPTPHTRSAPSSIARPVSRSPSALLHLSRRLGTPRSRPTCSRASRSPRSLPRSTRRRPSCYAPRRRRPRGPGTAGPVAISAAAPTPRRAAARPSGPRTFGRARGSRARGPRSRHVSWAFRQGAYFAVSPSSALARRCRPAAGRSRSGRAGPQNNGSQTAAAPSVSSRATAATRVRTRGAPTATASRCGASAVPARAAPALHSGKAPALSPAACAAPTPGCIVQCRTEYPARRYIGRGTRKHRPATP
mmetsp:Transcript_4630/g.11527  ORF Transcript_4630/g.11527 Transcript_4630/m.11527 type:complete len:248 (+) Transcript_4630:1162-1905(+)